MVVACVAFAPPTQAQTTSGSVSLVPVIDTVAGNGLAGYNGDGRTAISAALNQPWSVAADSAGNLYIADANSNRIRKVDTSGIISTVAGNGTAGYNGDGIPATSAELKGPRYATADSAGNLYIADTYNHRIRKVDTSGNISTVAGNGTAGFSGDGGAAISAALNEPYGVNIDSAGSLYIADTGNSRIRKVDTSGNISTVAGNGTGGFSGDGGAATSAELYQPFGVKVDTAGNLYIADTDNHRIRKVDTSGIISTVAGNGTAGFSGDGGAATSAELNQVYGVNLDAAGNLYIGDTFNYRIRKVDTSGNITTVAGDGTAGFSGDGGAATSAELYFPRVMTVDSGGNLYIADANNSRIRKVSTGTTLPTTVVGATSASQNVLVQLTAASAISSISVPKAQNNVQEFTVGAVTGCATDGTTSNASGTVCTVSITFNPQYPGQRTGALTLYSSGTTVLGSVGLSGTAYGPLAALTPAIISTVVGDGTPGSSGDGGAATSAELAGPAGIAVDSAGDLYIGDSMNRRVRKVDTSGIINAFAGTGTPGYTGDGGLATSAEMHIPYGVAVDSAGNLYIAVSNEERIRKVDTSGIINTVVGNGTAGYSGDGGAATAAELGSTLGIALDSTGNLYIADPANNRIRKVNTSGIINTVVGNGTAGYSGDGGAATSAELNFPDSVAVDGAGNLYIADTSNNRIRKVDTSGNISTVAGNGIAGYGGDGGAATSAELYNPRGVTVDISGNLYIGDFLNNRIRKVDISGNISTVAGNGVSGYNGDGVAATSVGLYRPYGVAVDGAGNLYIADSGNNRIRMINVSASSLAFASTAAGATSSNSPQTVKVSNIGNAALTISIPPSGLNPSVTTNFTLGSSGTCPQLDTTSSAATLAAGSSCTLALSFTPTVGGALTGTASIADNSPSAIQIVNLSGTGTQSGQSIIFPQPATPGTYGAAVTLTATASSGLAVTYAVTSGPATVSGSTLTLTGVGTVAVTASQAGDSGYTPATPVTRTITVNQATLTVTAANATRSYGAANPTFSGTYSGQVNGYTFTVSGATTATATSAPGSYPITPTAAGTDLANYTVTYVNGALTVGKAALTVTAANATRSYGAANPTLSGTYSGQVNGDTFTVSGATTATATSAPGSYPITPTATGADLANYTVTYVNGALTVTVATQTITFPPIGPEVYGTIPSTVMATSSAGSSYPVTIAVQSGPATISGNLMTITGAGTVVLAATQAGNADYGAAPAVTQSFTVTPVPLTVTANNATRTYGAANPAFTGTVTGAVNGDAFTESFSTTATPASDAGTYAIVPTAVGTRLSGYTVTTANGKLTVTAATTTTTLISSASAITAGQSMTFTATVMSGTSPVTSGTVTFLNEAASIGTGAVNANGVATFTTTTLPVGAGPSFTASYGATADYAASTSNAVAVTVASGAPVIAGTTTAVTASPASITAGGSVTLVATVTSSSGMPTGAVTFTSGGASLGMANLSGGMATVTTTALPVGTDPIVANYGGATTFAASSGTASVMVAASIPAGYTLVDASSSLDITQGQTGNSTLTLTPAGGYSGTIVLSCKGLPANAVCVFAQNPVKLTGNNQPVNVGLSIETSVLQARIEASPTPTQSPLSPILPAAAFWLPGGLAGLASFGRKRKLSKPQPRWLRLCLLLIATGTLAAGLSGCGSGGFGTYVTPAGKTTVTVLATATSGASVTTQTVALTLTIVQ